MGSPDRVDTFGPAARPARRHIGAALTACLLAGALLAGPVAAQLPPPPAGQPPPPPPGAASAIYSPAQLDQMMAPVALYPDDLLGQMLMAATYPLEIVQADRWLQNPANASLRGDALAQALEQMPWDASVKSLCAYPQILAWMDSALEWTEAVGDAFLAQQPDVMDSVQRLRARAQAAGNLSSTPQQTVTASDGAIQIGSPDSSMEYVPVYSPDTAYGPWPYSDYPPYDFAMPGYAVGTFISFPILFPYWGWDHWDWHRHHIDIDNGVGQLGRHVPMRPVPWQHDPAHRGGIPYRDPGTRARFLGPSDVHRDYRGYPTRPSAAPATAPVGRVAPPAARPPIAERPAQAPPTPRPPVYERPAPTGAPAAAEVRRPVPVAPRPEAPRPVPRAVERPMAPALESFGRGAEVHAQEIRGATSRAAPPAVGAVRGGHR
jgi:hypothetical protein